MQSATSSKPKRSWPFHVDGYFERRWRSTTGPPHADSRRRHNSPLPRRRSPGLVLIAFACALALVVGLDDFPLSPRPVCADGLRDCQHSPANKLYSSDSVAQRRRSPFMRIAARHRFDRQLKVFRWNVESSLRVLVRIGGLGRGHFVSGEATMRGLAIGIAIFLAATRLSSAAEGQIDAKTLVPSRSARSTEKMRRRRSNFSA